MDLEGGGKECSEKTIFRVLPDHGAFSDLEGVYRAGQSWTYSQTGNSTFALIRWKGGGKEGTGLTHSLPISLSSLFTPIHLPAASSRFSSSRKEESGRALLVRSAAQEICAKSCRRHV